MLAAGRAAALAAWLAYCLLPHLLTRLVRGRSGWPRRFLAGCARICGADVRTEGDPVRPHTLLLVNHVSWLDVFVLAGATGCAFVSKAEMADGRLIKWLADQNNTLYVRRSDKRALGNQVGEVAAALRDRDQPLALFPEGTVGTGGILLPFRPSLLSAVVPPPPNLTVRPVALDYGAVFPELGWGPGEHGMANAVRLLGRRGRIAVTVRLLDPLARPTDRKLLAKQAHDSIAGALASSGIVPAAL